MATLLPELILRRARERPDAPAVVAAGRTLTYRELSESAGRIAHALRERGVGPESVVGVVARPSAERIAALLGIWLAGGCYLPFDPLHPARRLHRAVALAGARLVVSDAPVSLPPGVAACRLDELDDRSLPARPPAGTTAARQAAYLVFTSGSTGEPKGTVVEHEGIANLARWSVDRLGITPADRLLHKTPPTFDAALWEILTPLSCGGPVILAGVEAAHDPRALIRAVLDSRATVLQAVPSMLRLLAAEPELAACRDLRMIVSGGEPLHAELCQQILRQVDVEIWNVYGPAECTIDATAHRFDRSQVAGPVPIGRPVDGMRCVTVGPDGAAELYLAGVGVGRGYQGDPALTAQRYLPDPAGPPGARMYRTGDLVRARADGSLEFVGRTDAQLKLNGVRIEPGEVEAAILTHPHVLEAGVRAATDPHGVTRLVACVVTTPGGAIDDLAAHLRQRLPATLVPAVFTVLPVLPRNASGKTDRTRLPEPDWESAPSRAAARPQTTQQRIVLEIWRDLLGVEDIGLDDDFFRVGGHSLMMARLVPRLVEASGLALHLGDIYQAMTVRAQAEVLSRAMLARPIPRLPEGARLPLSYTQERFWLLDRLDPGSPEYLVPLVVRLPSGTPLSTVEAALARLAERHDVLRSRYVMDAEGLRAVVDPPGTVAVRVAERVDGAAPLPAEEFVSGFDLTTGPLWRAVLVPGHGSGDLLLLVLHHIVCDGWSTGLLDREIRELVAALSRSRPPRLPDLPLRYPDFAAWQRTELTAGRLAADLDHWRRELAGLPPLGMPTSRPRDARRRIDGAVVAFDIPEHSASALLALGRAAGATPFMTFLTVWSVLLARASGEWDFGVGTPYAGRGRPESHDVVGPFLNTLVLRPALRPGMSLRDSLQSVRRTCRTAFAHAAAPFEAVVDAVRPERDQSRTPLFQTLFTMVDGLLGADPHDDDADLMRDGWPVARTDLTLTMWPHADGRFGAALEYASALYSRTGMRDLARRMVEVAAALAADPDAPIGAELQASPPGAAALAAAPVGAEPRPNADTDRDAPAGVQAPAPHVATVLEMFQQLLGREDVGLDEDFFTAGGTSLQAARLLWTVQSVFGVTVPMRAIFDQPTPAGLAAVVERLVRAEIDDSRVPAGHPGEERLR